jgi:hypothetical protein
VVASGRSPAFGHSVYFGLIVLAGTILGRIVPVVASPLVWAAVVLTSRPDQALKAAGPSGDLTPRSSRSGT